MSDSFIRRFLFEHLDIRGAVVHLGAAWQQMQAGRGYQPVSYTHLVYAIVLYMDMLLFAVGGFLMLYKQ